MNINILSSLLFFWLFGCSGPTEVQELNSAYVITDVNIINVEKGRLLPPTNVIIVNDRIFAISDEVPEEDSIYRIDGTGKYLIPGLWDMHTHYHWNSEYSSELLIANGVTGVREMWGDMKSVKKLRKTALSRSKAIPDIYSSGMLIDGSPKLWKESIEVEDAEEAIDEIEDQVKEGVDFFKVYSMLSREAYFAIAEKSEEVGIPFAGHVPNSISMFEAIDAGQQSTEHLYGLLDACSSDQGELTEINKKQAFGPEKSMFLVKSFDQNIFDSLLTVLSSSDTWISPTLIVLKQISHLDDSILSKDPRMEYMPESIHEMWNPDNDFRFKTAGQDYYNAQKAKFWRQLSLMGDMERAGVKIIAGTDFPNPYCYPGFSLHDEFELMAQGGMTTGGVLKSATYNPAVFMNKTNDFGTVDEGKIASLVILGKNPLESISNTRSIEGVFLRGEYFPRPKLDSLLQQAKQFASR